MSKMSEAMLGLLIFFAFIVPFQIKIFASFLDVYFYTQSTTEMTQRIKEDGGYGESASRYADVLRDKGISFQIKDESGRSVTNAGGYTGKTLYVTYDRTVKFDSGGNEFKAKRTDDVFISRRD